MVRLIAIVASLLAIGFLIFGLNPTAKAGGITVVLPIPGVVHYDRHHHRHHFDRRDDRREHRR